MRTKHFTYDQDKVTQLRMAVIHAALDVMNDDPKVKKWSNYKKEMIMKIAPRVLPVLQEHSGRDGGKIEISFDPVFNETTRSTETDSKE